MVRGTFLVNQSDVIEIFTKLKRTLDKYKESARNQTDTSTELKN